MRGGRLLVVVAALGLTAAASAEEGAISAEAQASVDAQAECLAAEDVACWLSATGTLYRAHPEAARHRSVDLHAFMAIAFFVAATRALSEAAIDAAPDAPRRATDMLAFLETHPEMAADGCTVDCASRAVAYAVLGDLPTGAPFARTVLAPESAALRDADRRWYAETGAGAPDPWRMDAAAYDAMLQFLAKTYSDYL